MRSRFSYAAVALLMLMTIVSGCTGAGQDTQADGSQSSKELVIYSGRREPLLKPVAEAFEEKTGIRVVLKSAGATELANLILEEQSRPRADIYIATDAGALERLRLENALESYTSPNLEAVPEDLRSPDGTWYAATARARVIMYNKDLVSESELPNSLMELPDPKWKGQVGMATGANESVIANVTALRLIEGEEETERFLQSLKDNDVRIYKGHSDVRRAVGRGEIKLGWVNHYYYHMQVHENEHNHVGIIYPDQDGQGVTVNVSGAAIVKGAPNLDNAKAFMDFLLTPETQKLFAEVNYEMPVLPDVPVKEALPLHQIKRNRVKLGEFGTHWDKSVELIDRLGLVLQ